MFIVHCPPKRTTSSFPLQSENVPTGMLTGENLEGLRGAWDTVNIFILLCWMNLPIKSCQNQICDKFTRRVSCFTYLSWSAGGRRELKTLLAILGPAHKVVVSVFKRHSFFRQPHHDGLNKNSKTLVRVRGTSQGQWRSDKSPAIREVIASRGS